MFQRLRGSKAKVPGRRLGKRDAEKAVDLLLEHLHLIAIHSTESGDVHVYRCRTSWRCSLTTSLSTCLITYSVSQKNHPRGFLTFYPKRLGIFCPNFTNLLHVSIYAKLQIFVELSPTVTKLCHIKCDHPAACVSVDGGHFEHIMVVALNMA